MADDDTNSETRTVTDSSTDQDTFSIEEVHDVNAMKGTSETEIKYKKKIIAAMEIAGQPNPVMIQVDCGSDVDVLPQRCDPASSVSTMMKTSSKLKGYSSSKKIPVLGICNLKIRNPKTDETYIVQFNVVEGKNCMPLIGSKTAQIMNLIKVKYKNMKMPKVNALSDEVNSNVGVTRDELLNKHEEVFEGLGHMPGKVHLEIKEDAKPVIMPPRHVPMAIKPKLKDELTRLEKLGVIKKVNNPTDWVSSMVTVVKPNGKLRVCIDPLHLNKALKHSHYPLPVIEDILPDLSQVKVFSKADCREGFLQCELDEESSYLTTFQSPWGRYRWTRLPFGITPAPEIFKQKLDQCLENLKGIHKIADDILITGEGLTLREAMKDHDANMEKFLERCNEKQIKLKQR